MFSLKELKDRISGKMRDVSNNSKKSTSALSIEGHVNKLIIESTKVENLAGMYTGWQSYW
jgi:phosphatidylinositol kinase/protein kinase (PI-3  family)